MATSVGFTSEGIQPNRATGVRFVRQELTDMLEAYETVSDCIAGSDAIKKKKIRYLPMPDPANRTEDNLARYDSYISRAVFYNVTQRTAIGLLGQIFMRPPAMEMPAALDPVKDDSNGSGIGIEQLAKDACLLNIAYGRLGVFVDYPPVTAPTTKAELESGNIRPTITIYKPVDVINWRTKTIGSKQVYTLVVLQEEYTVEDDQGFETKTGTQYRELRLSNAGVYSVQLWRASDPNGDNFEKFGAPYFPTDGKGKALDAIPFTFVGSKNNESSVDPPPLKDMADINIAHYHNSADYEEMIYVIGQPMLVITGLKQNWYNDILKKKIPFGSRNGLPLHEGCTAELIQVAENTAAKEGMEHKERQMVALGAKIVQNRDVQRTATEAGNETAAEESTLVSIAKNVSAALKWALQWCAVFLKVPEKAIKFELNTDFELSRMSADEINATIESWVSEAISWTEMRLVLRKAGRATQTDEDAKKEIEADQKKQIEKAALEIGAATKATTQNSPPNLEPGSAA